MFKRRLYFCLFIFYFVQISQCFALMVETHKDLNGYIVRNSAYGQL